MVVWIQCVGPLSGNGGCHFEADATPARANAQASDIWGKLRHIGAVGRIRIGGLQLLAPVGFIEAWQPGFGQGGDLLGDGRWTAWCIVSALDNPQQQGLFIQPTVEA